MEEYAPAPGVATARPVAVGLMVAAVTLVLAVLLQIAYWVEMAHAVQAFNGTHIGGGAFCAYAFRNPGNTSVGNPWLGGGSALALLVGGVACLSLALLRRSRGSPHRRAAIAMGFVSVVLAPSVFIATVAVDTVLVLSCYG